MVDEIMNLNSDTKVSQRPIKGKGPTKQVGGDSPIWPKNQFSNATTHDDLFQWAQYIKHLEQVKDDPS